MDAAKVDNQLTVHVQPEVVVAREFIDDVVAPVVLAVGGLGEGGFHFHAQVIVLILDEIQLLVLSGIRLGKNGTASRCQILGAGGGEKTGLQIVIGEELSVLIVHAAVVHGADLFVYQEVVSLEAGKILGAVVLIVSGGPVGAFDKQMIDFPGLCEPAGKIVSGLRGGIPVFAQAGGKQIGICIVHRAACVAAQEVAHLLPAAEVGQPHSNALLGAVHG